jgi:hypothetical protein
MLEQHQQHQLEHRVAADTDAHKVVPTVLQLREDEPSNLHVHACAYEAAVRMSPLRGARVRVRKSALILPRNNLVNKRKEKKKDQQQRLSKSGAHFEHRHVCARATERRKRHSASRIMAHSSCTFVVRLCSARSAQVLRGACTSNTPTLQCSCAS